MTFDIEAARRGEYYDSRTGLQFIFGALNESAEATQRLIGWIGMDAVKLSYPPARLVLGPLKRYRAIAKGPIRIGIEAVNADLAKGSAWLPYPGIEVGIVEIDPITGAETPV